MPSNLVRFGAFAFDETALSLYRRGERVPLRPQVARALEVLVAHAAEDVSREVLADHIWPQGTHVDQETGLNTCIRRLRSVLGDQVSDPRYVLTLPGRGYRFIAAIERDPAPASDRVAPAPVIDPGADPVAVVDEGAATVRSQPPASATTAPIPPSESTRRRDRSPRWRDRRWLVVAALLAVAFVAGGWWLGKHSVPSGDDGVAPRASFAQPMTVVLVSDLEPVGWMPGASRALTEAFRIGIEQSPALRVLSPTEAADALARMGRAKNGDLDIDGALELARREGLSAVASLHAAQVAADTVLIAELVAAQDGASLAVRRTSVADASRALDAIDGLAAEVLAALDLEALPSGPTERLATVTTANLEALEAYSAAVDCAHRPGQETYLALLRRAVQLDPTFAMAHARLGVALRNRGQPTEGYRHMRTAAEHADQLTTFERLYVEGWLATLRSETEASIRSWLVLSELFPDRVAGHVNLALSRHAFRNDFRACAAAAETGLAALGDRHDAAPTLRRIRGRCLLADGRIADALALVPDSGEGPFAAAFAAHTALAAGDGAAFRAALAGWTDGSAPERGRRHALRALAAADDGHWQRAADAALQAEAAFEAGARSASRRGARLAYLAYLGASEDADLRAAFDAAAAELGSVDPLGVDDVADPQVSQALLLLISLAARLGLIDWSRAAAEAGGLGEATGRDDLWRAHRALAEAELMAARGEVAGASRHLGRALATATVHPLHARERQAAWLHALGRGDEARALDRWIVRHRGRVFAECLGGADCYDRPLNVVAWHRAASREPSAHALVAASSRDRP